MKVGLKFGEIEAVEGPVMQVYTLLATIIC